MIEREREETFRCKLKRMAVGRTNSSQWKAIRPTIYRDLPPTTISIHMDKLIRNVALCTYDPHHNEGTCFRETSIQHSRITSNLFNVPTRATKLKLFTPLYTSQALPKLFKIGKKFRKRYYHVYILKSIVEHISSFFSLLFFRFKSPYYTLRVIQACNRSYTSNASCPSSPTFSVHPLSTVKRRVAG